MSLPGAADGADLGGSSKYSDEKPWRTKVEKGSAATVVVRE